jgi:hypothetical protein
MGEVEEVEMGSVEDEAEADASVLIPFQPQFNKPVPFQVGIPSSGGPN